MAGGRWAFPLGAAAPARAVSQNRLARGDAAVRAVASMNVADARRVLRDVEGRYERVTGRAATRKELLREVRTAGGRLSSLRRQCSREEAQLSALGTTRRELETKVAVVLLEMDDARDDLDAKRKLLGGIQTFEELQAAIKDLEVKRSELVEQVGELAGIVERREVRDRLDAQIEERRGVLADLNRQIADVQRLAEGVQSILAAGVAESFERLRTEDIEDIVRIGRAALAARSVSAG